MKIEGSVTIVTGGASGLGRGVVDSLVARGGRAVVLDLPGTAGAAVADGDQDLVAHVPVDVSDPAQVETAMQAAADAFGRVDALVSCAGISTPRRTISRDGTLLPIEEFRRHLEVNLTGLFDVVRHAAAAMARNEPGEDGERGLIVNVASIAALEGQTGQVSYTAAKGGVVAMTLPLARDLAPLGIRVLCVCPGTMDTPMLGVLTPENLEGLRAAQLFPKRLGSPSDLGSLVMTFMEQTFLNAEVVQLDAGTRLAVR